MINRDLISYTNQKLATCKKGCLSKHNKKSLRNFEVLFCKIYLSLSLKLLIQCSEFWLYLNTYIYCYNAFFCGWVRKFICFRTYDIVLQVLHVYKNNQGQAWPLLQCYHHQKKFPNLTRRSGLMKQVLEFMYFATRCSKSCRLNISYV